MEKIIEVIGGFLFITIFYLACIYYDFKYGWSSKHFFKDGKNKI